MAHADLAATDDHGVVLSLSHPFAALGQHREVFVACSAVHGIADLVRRV